MKRMKGICVVAVAATLVGCVTTTTTVKKSVDAPVSVEGLNILYVKAPLTAVGGGIVGYTPGTVAVDTNQLADAVARGVPKILETKTIPTTVATTEISKGGPSINLNRQFPLTAKTHHLLVVTPVAAKETCKVHAAGYPYDCITRLTVTARLMAPGDLSILWESQLQEARLRKCADCAQRFEGFAEDIAEEVMKVVVKRPGELSQGLAGQIKLDDSRPLFDLGQKPDGVTPILGGRPKK